MTLREDPPSPPPCPRCHGLTSEYDDTAREIHGRPWYCPAPCSTFHAGTAAEAMKHAARVIADRATRDDLANKASTIAAIREELTP